MLTITQSTRKGGVSPYPANALNLGRYTDDDPENVAENRRRFAAAIGWDVSQFAGARQIHGTNIKLVEAPGEYDGYDALITNQQNILLTITTADCIPVLIHDPVNNAYGAAHAGWKGTVGRIAAKTLRAMIENFGTDPARCQVVIAAGISHCYFEVKKDVGQYFSEHLISEGPAAGQYFVDLPQANVDQLTAMGVPLHHISRSAYCTVGNNDLYFSYRAENGNTGRMLAVIGRKK